MNSVVYLYKVRKQNERSVSDGIIITLVSFVLW